MAQQLIHTKPAAVVEGTLHNVLHAHMGWLNYKCVSHQPSWLQWKMSLQDTWHQEHWWLHHRVTAIGGCTEHCVHPTRCPSANRLLASGWASAGHLSASTQERGKWGLPCVLGACPLPLPALIFVCTAHKGRFKPRLIPEPALTINVKCHILNKSPFKCSIWFSLYLKDRNGTSICWHKPGWARLKPGSYNSIWVC